MPGGMFFVKNLKMRLPKNILILILLGISIMQLRGNTTLNLPEDENKILVFPNPVTEGFVNIQAEKEILQVEILNIVGQRILIQEPVSLNSMKLDVSNLEAGIYLLKLSFSDNTNNIKRIWVK